MTLPREILKATRGTLLRCVTYLDRVLAPPAKPEPILSEEAEAEQARELGRKSRRAGTRRWNQNRPDALKIPAWLDRYESLYGTRATLEHLRKLSKRDDD